jgi:chromosome segregation ATPase
MSDTETRELNKPLLLSIAALVLAAGGLIWSFGLQNHVSEAEKQLAAAQQQNTLLQQKIASTDARLRATSETFGQSLGVTQKQLELKSEAILARQQADTQRLEKTQAATQEKIGQVSTEVSTVKTDVGGVKTDVAATKTDLEQTKSQLQRTIGDAGVMSGLIARTHEDLEVLKHRGDRNYYEFTLHKGDKPVNLSTIRVQLKKVDTKRSKFTMVVSADDRNIEKKDKNLMEPVQFYSGKDPALYEIVVNNLDKNTVSGYLSTPKGQ